MTSSTIQQTTLGSVRTDAGRVRELTSQAFFHLAGHTCVTVPRGAKIAGMGHEIGQLELDGDSYVVCEYQLHNTPCPQTAIGQLTKRECEIALLIAAGKMNKQIAHQLCISCWTVGTYIRRIFAKLNVQNRTELAGRLISEIKGHD